LENCAPQESCGGEFGYSIPHPFAAILLDFVRYSLEGAE
jgi:hypothetical protein